MDLPRSCRGEPKTAFVSFLASRGQLAGEEIHIFVRCLAPFFPHRLDEALAKLKVFYVRFMDDTLVLTPARWKLRKAVKLLNQSLNAHRLGKHPDKTYIGRITKGFDSLWLSVLCGKIGDCDRTP